jgi:glucan phosphoethanolaminetransferase (alkaline phosphatase superfamily)
MKKYSNTKTIIAVSNKPAILVYVVAALMISTGALYFIVASQDYSELPQSSAASNNNTDSKDEGDTIATVNEIVFFIVVGIAYTAAGIWMLENKYYSKVSYVIATIGSIALIAFYISTRMINIPSIGIQDDVGAIDILSKVLQAAIAGISIYILRSSTVIWRSATTRAQPSSLSSQSSSAAEILEHEVRKMQNRNENQERNKDDSSGL